MHSTNTVIQATLHPNLTGETGNAIMPPGAPAGFTVEEASRGAWACLGLLEAAKVIADPSAPNTADDFARLRQAVAAVDDILAFAKERQRQIDAGEWPPQPAPAAIVAAQISTPKGLRAWFAKALRRTFGRG